MSQITTPSPHELVVTVDQVRRQLGSATGREAVEHAVISLREMGGDHVFPSVYEELDGTLWLVAQAGYDGVLDAVPTDVGVMGRVFRSRQTELVIPENDPDCIDAQPGFVAEITSTAGNLVVNIESTRSINDDVRGPFEVLTSDLYERFIDGITSLDRMQQDLTSLIRLARPELVIESATRALARESGASVAMAVVDLVPNGRLTATWRTPSGDSAMPEPDRLVELTHRLSFGGAPVILEPDELAEDGGPWSGVPLTMAVPMMVEDQILGGVVLGIHSRPNHEAYSRVALIGSVAGACLQRAARETELIDALTARGEFIRAVSHEFRTPLTAIVGYADLILETGTSEQEIPEFVDTIRRNGAHLLAMVTDLLDIARSDAGRLTIRTDEVADVDETIREALALIEPQAKESHVSITTDIEADSLVVGDRLRIRQVIVNLVANSIKFSGGGNVRVGAFRSADSIVIEVEDDGEGMTIDEVGGLFLPFSGRSVRDPRSGSGLGLVISRRLTEAMGGTLEVSSLGPNQGTTARLVLPVGPMTDHGAESSHRGR